MNRLLNMIGLQTRATVPTVKTSDPYLAEFFTGRGSGVLANVDMDRASGLSTAYACIRVIAESLASVPLRLYRETPQGKEKAKDHPLYGVLARASNPNMTAFECREYLIASVFIRGNAYARIEWNSRGQVVALHPLDPLSVSVDVLSSGKLRYRHLNKNGQTVILSQAEVLHIRHRIGPDGCTGISPISAARETFETALGQQNLTQKQTAKGFRPEGVLSFPSPIDAEGKTGALDALATKAENTTARGGILVLDGGATWDAMPFSSRDAEFLESRKLSDLAIARVFGVPPTSCGIPDDSNLNTLTGENQALVQRCLGPAAQRVDQALNAALIPESQRDVLKIEHDLSGLLRGDIEARYGAYAIARNAGIMSANEIRQLENLPEIEGGDEIWRPLNMGGQN